MSESCDPEAAGKYNKYHNSSVKVSEVDKKERVGYNVGNTELQRYLKTGHFNIEPLKSVPQHE